MKCVYVKLISMCKNSKYPTERVDLLQHRYNQHRKKISLCSRHGIAEHRLTSHRTTTTHLLCNINKL